MDTENLDQYSTAQLWAMLNEAENEDKVDLLIELHERLYKSEDYIQASTLAEQAAAVASTCMENEVVENARYRQGLALWKADRYDEAIVAFKAGVDAYQEPDPKVELSKNQWGIASCHYHMQNYEESVNWSSTATQTALVADEYGIAGLNKFLEAQALYLADKDYEALIACEEARGYRRQVQHLSQVAEIDAYMASINTSLGNYDKSVDLLRNCLVLAEATSDSIPYYSYRLGNSLIDTGEFEEARSHLERARKGYEDSEDHGSLADCYYSLCLTYGNHEATIDLALENLRSAISLWDALGNDRSYLKGLEKLSILLFSKGDIKGAIETNIRIIESVNEEESVFETEVLGWALLRLSDCYRVEEDLNQALEILESSDIFGQYSIHLGNNWFYSLKARVLYALGRHEEAMGVADTALSRTEDKDVSSHTAYLYEIKARVSLEQDRPDKERHLAHAIALHLAFGETRLARELSDYFKPRFSPIAADSIITPIDTAKSEPQSP